MLKYVFMIAMCQKNKGIKRGIKEQQIERTRHLEADCLHLVDRDRWEMRLRIEDILSRKETTYRLGGQPFVVQEVAHVLQSTLIQNIHHGTGNNTGIHEAIFQKVL